MSRSGLGPTARARNGLRRGAPPRQTRRREASGGWGGGARPQKGGGGEGGGGGGKKGDQWEKRGEVLKARQLKNSHLPRGVKFQKKKGKGRGTPVKEKWGAKKLLIRGERAKPG